MSPVTLAPQAPNYGFPKTLVASALTDHQWEQIVLVENAIQVIDNTRLMARRLSQVTAESFGPVLLPLEQELFRQNLPKFELAAGALLGAIESNNVEISSSVETR